MLRWWTGESLGAGRVYEALRRWALRQDGLQDRPALLRELARLAALYGIVTGTNGPHRDRKVEHHLRHLREMKIDTHRPLTLKLLDDAEQMDGLSNGNEGLARAIGGIGTWISRLWLADRSLTGLNSTIAEFAHGPGPGENEEFADYWLKRISALRTTRVRIAVPNDEAVREGIRTRQAYGGSATQTSRAILCAMMEREHREEAPGRDRLTIEHVMPRKLEKGWKNTLGNDAEDIHGRWRNRLANLTLSGDDTNSKLGARAFKAKKRIYRGSPIGMTRRVADEPVWNEEALERRADALADEALRLWPWEAAGQTARESPIKWRINQDEWHFEDVAGQMVMNVASALISRDPSNAQKLSGKILSDDLFFASSYSSDSRSRHRLVPVPGHEEFLIYPYHRNVLLSADRCRRMGARCGVEVEVELPDANRVMEFWKFLQEHAGGTPGQRSDWYSRGVWSSPLNSAGDRICIRIGDGFCRLWISGWDKRSRDQRAERMQRYSLRLQEHMTDQTLTARKDVGRDAANGYSLSVRLETNAFDDESAWPDLAIWIKDQTERMAAIMAD